MKSMSNAVEVNQCYERPRTQRFGPLGEVDAKNVVQKLGSDVRFEMIDTSTLVIGRLLEPVAMLRFHLAFTIPLGREFAFKLPRR